MSSRISTRIHVKELYTPCYLCDDVVREGSRRFDALEPPPAKTGSGGLLVMALPIMGASLTATSIWRGPISTLATTLPELSASCHALTVGKDPIQREGKCWYQNHLTSITKSQAMFPDSPLS